MLFQPREDDPLGGDGFNDRRGRLMVLVHLTLPAA